MGEIEAYIIHTMQSEPGGVSQDNQQTANRQTSRGQCYCRRGGGRHAVDTDIDHNYTELRFWEKSPGCEALDKETTACQF